MEWFVEKKKRIYNFLLVIILIFLIVCFRLLAKIETIRQLSKIGSLIQFEPQYVVDSTRCKIRNLNPYDSQIMPFHNRNEYISCEKRGLLTYVKKENDVSILYVEQRRVKEYTDGSINCCYSVINPSNVTKENPPTETTVKFNFTTCQYFQYKIPMPSEFIIVTCKENTSQEVYRNVHATINIKKEVEKKMEQFDEEPQNHLSVLFIGIDSVSRSHLVRSLPSTHSFLKQNGWLEFKAYNKIGESTFSNLMALLTGLNESVALRTCDPSVKGSLDKCKMIWYDYGDLGYITAYAEDEVHLGDFNYLKNGFKNQPTDYYFRPYMIAAQSYLSVLKIDGNWFCTGPEASGERVFNLAKDFVTTFKYYPNFGFFWMNSYSHENVGAVSRMDEKIVDFFTDLIKHEILENSIVIFLSDQGFRKGPIIYTQAGQLESRLPFLYMWIPEWFRKKHSNKYKNLITNTKRLISAYDLYMTVQDILVLSGKDYIFKKSRGCPNCKSIFEQIDKDRSCENAGIEHHWCTCHNYVDVPEKALTIHAAKFIINEIRKVRASFGKHCARCTRFQLDKVLDARVSNNYYIVYENTSFLLITLQTLPKAVFQATVSINMTLLYPVFRLEGNITRIDEHHATSWCVKIPILKKYCYCIVQYLYDVFMHP